jgi:hypothetical protein
MRRLKFLVLASLFVGCSLMTRYDQDGQPCDKSELNPALSCLSDAGYTCVSGFCKKGTATSSDGGLDAGLGVDSGSPDAGDGGTDGGNLGG